MMSCFKVFLLTFSLGSFLYPSPQCFAESSAPNVKLEPVFPGVAFSRPVDFQTPRDKTGRVFIVEQEGRIVLIDPRTPDQKKIFLDISSRVLIEGAEMGLLGLAFHPDFKRNGLFYINYTTSNPRRTVIAQYRVLSGDPDQADPESEKRILEYVQPNINHNGGQLAFGQDGYLYIAAGDGGGAGDTYHNGQNLKSLLAKILRIDVDRPSGGKLYGIPPDNPFIGNSSGYREETYAYGLRNPWRFSFDKVTGRLWAADVGQDKPLEEVDLIEKGKNYGWPIMEGRSCYSPAQDCHQEGLEMPVWEYSADQGRSITGGFVYRGKALRELQGAYIYGDFVSGKVWALKYDGVNPPVNQEILNSGFHISSFGVDEQEELYVCSYMDGKIYKFLPVKAPGIKELDRPSIQEAVRLGKEHLLNRQKPEGHFIYEYDFLVKEELVTESEVRQAGALWGLALLYADQPDDRLFQALQKGIGFFELHSKSKSGKKWIAYPDAEIGHTGIVALTALAHIELLRTPARKGTKKIKKSLKEYIQFLLSLQGPDGSFSSYYDLDTGKPLGTSSDPYAEGEVLLALTKAVKYLGYEKMRRNVMQTADYLYRKYVQTALLQDPDSPLTKGFYQWGTMAYFEIFTAQWPGHEIYAERVLHMAQWMIDAHKILQRRRNTAYAYEGLIPAWEIARLTGKRELQMKIDQVIRTGLLRLMAWQIGSAFQNDWLKALSSQDPKAVGGVLNEESNPVLRIDVTQHQIHAMILARRYVFSS